MISALQIRNPERSCISWWKDVAWLEGKSTLEFKPGLNIIWGPNGVGKSTVLKAIARMLHCEQGGVQTVTQHSVSKVFGFIGNAMLDGVVPLHDGAPVVLLDPGHSVGLVGGGAAFDEDFFSEGVASKMAEKSSSGQQTLHKLDSLLGPVTTGQFSKPDWKIDPNKVNTTWASRLQQVQKVLGGTLRPETPQRPLH